MNWVVITAAANALLALSFYVIGGLIVAGLVAERHRGFNPLGIATAFIFLTCGTGHAIHFEHYLVSAGMQSADLWHQTVIDAITIVPALAYLAQRSRYGLVIRGPHALLDFQRRLDLAETLRATGQDIAAQTDLDALVGRIACHARTLAGADYAVVVAQGHFGGLHHEANGVDTSGWDEDTWTAATAPLSALDNAACTQPLIVADCRRQSKLEQDCCAAHIGQGARSLVFVPLVRGEAGIGWLVAGYRSPHPTMTDEGARLAVLAGQAAVAIENARLIDGLRQADRMKDEFVSVAAHELKTPVQGLRGFAQTLLRQYETHGTVEPDRLRRALNVFDEQSDRLSRLVTQLLDVSRIEAGRLELHREETDVLAIVEDVARAGRLRTDRHTIVVDAPGPVIAVVDRLRFEQVVANMVDNAIKYSPDGGAIEIRVAEGPGTVEVAVRDHGMGVPEDKRAFLFDRFYQAQTNGYRIGMGLGLHISKQFAEAHGGSIIAEFPADGGTRFVFSVPKAVSEPAESAPCVKIAYT